MDLSRLQPSAFTSATADLSIESVWAVASNPLLLPGFSSELQAVRLLDPGPIGLGSRFEGDQLRGERRWTTTSTITDYVPRCCFEWSVGDLSHPVSRWSFLLDENADGTTLCHRVVLCGGPSPLSDRVAERPREAEAVVHERLVALRERMAVTVAGLVDLARKSEEKISNPRG
ncbi:MAG: SRPBCC family protein [Acidimicrobiales bacterium]